MDATRRWHVKGLVCHMAAVMLIPDCLLKGNPPPPSHPHPFDPTFQPYRRLRAVGNTTWFGQDASQQPSGLAQTMPLAISRVGDDA